MENLVAVDNKNHLKTCIDINKRELHAQALHYIPIVLAEFSNVAVQYPIVLTKNADTGQFVFVAMLGFEAGENLFWHDQQWQGLYLPLHIRRQPFFVGNSESENQACTSGNDYVVCIDSDSPTITLEGGTALFDERGLDSDYFQDTKACLSQLLQGEVENKNLIEHLQNMDLIQSMSLEVTFENQQSTRLNGLYTIDSDKMAKLNEEQVLVLHKSGILPAIYTLMTSLGQIPTLIELKNKRLL